jgi:hypothetical protein
VRARGVLQVRGGERHRIRGGNVQREHLLQQARRGAAKRGGVLRVLRDANHGLQGVQQQAGVAREQRGDRHHVRCGVRLIIIPTALGVVLARLDVGDELAGRLVKIPTAVIAGAHAWVV